MLGLPERRGRRPRTSETIPHRQLDEQPDDSSLLDALLAEASSWPGVGVGPSAISVAGARALVLAPEHRRGPSVAFLAGGEFCHVHGGGDHSLHATLPVDVASAAQAAGWAEPHFLVHSGRLAPTVVMLYAPRDAADAVVLLGLVRESYRFGAGVASARRPAPHHGTLESTA